MTTSMFKKGAASAAVAMALLGAGSALADTGVYFDPTGSSGAGMLVSSFSWQQNSIIADNAFNNSAGATSLSSVLAGQGWLSLLNGPSAVANNQFSYVFSIDVTANKTGTGSGDTVTFTDGQAALPTATTATNYFRMYYNGPGSATNAHFDSGDNVSTGTLVLSGAVYLDSNSNIAGTSGSGSSFQISNTTEAGIAGLGSGGSTTQGGNQIRTIGGSGGFVLDVNVLTFNSAFFRSDINSLSLDLTFNENMVDPFSGVRVPSAIDNITPNFGAVVGGQLHNNFVCDGGAAPCDMIFGAQTAGTSVNNEVVPEPGTLALLGLGLLGFARFSLRKRS